MGASRFNKVKRIHLLNVPIDILNPEDLEEILRQMLSDKEKHQIVLLDIWGFLKARGHGLYSRMVHESSLVLPISKMILRGARFLKRDVPFRPLPFELIINLLGILERLNQSVYLLGARAKCLNTIAGNLRTSFPTLRIVGRHTGFFRKDREQDILLAIKKASPSLLLAGYGLHGKELWLFENKQHFAPGITLWNGDCLDIFCGKKEKPSKKSWEKGTYFIPDLFKHPWRIFRGFAYLGYYFLLIVHRIRKL